MDNKIVLKGKPKKKYYISKNKKNEHNIKMINKRPLSSNSQNVMILNNNNESLTIRKINSKDEKDENDIPKISLYKNNKNKNYDKKVMSNILSGDLNPHNLKKDINIEKYLKRILGTRYKNHFISYEEEKFAKLVESYNIQEKFLNKRNNYKLSKNNSDYNPKYVNRSRAMSAKVKINTALLKK